MWDIVMGYLATLTMHKWSSWARKRRSGWALPLSAYLYSLVIEKNTGQRQMDKPSPRVPYGHSIEG